MTLKPQSDPFMKELDNDLANQRRAANAKPTVPVYSQENRSFREMMTLSQYMENLTGSTGHDMRTDFNKFIGKKRHSYIVGQNNSGKTELLKLLDFGFVAYCGSTVIHRETEKKEMLSLAPIMPKGKFYVHLPEGVKITGTTVKPEQVRYFEMFEPRELPYNIATNAINIIMHDHFAGYLESNRYEQIGWFWIEFLNELIVKQTRLPVAELENNRVDLVVDEANNLFPSHGNIHGGYVSLLSKDAPVQARVSRGLNIMWHCSSHGYKQVIKSLRNELHFTFAKKLEESEADQLVGERVKKMAVLKKKVLNQVLRFDPHAGSYLFCDLNGDYDILRNRMLPEGHIDFDFNLDNFDTRTVIEHLKEWLEDNEWLVKVKSPKETALGHALSISGIPKFTIEDFSKAWRMFFAAYNIQIYKHGRKDIEDELDFYKDLQKKTEVSKHTFQKDYEKAFKIVQKAQLKIKMLEEDMKLKTRNELIYFIVDRGHYTRKEAGEAFGISLSSVSRTMAYQKRKRTELEKKLQNEVNAEALVNFPKLKPAEHKV